MNIAIDGRFIDQVPGWTANYSRELVLGLSDIDRENHYWIIRAGNGDRPLKTNQQNFNELWFDGPVILNPRWEQIALASELAKQNIDLYFAPTGILPVAFKGKLVCLAHDLGFERRPDSVEPGLLAYLKEWVPAAFQTADIIVVDSQAAKRDIEELYRIDCGKIRVIYPFCSSAFSPVKNETKANEILKKYCITKKYVLTASGRNDDKNLEGALKIIASAIIDSREEYEIVVIGKSGGQSREIMNLITELGLEANTVLAGQVPVEDLPVLYSTAVCCLFTPTHEGFNHAVLEALSCGAPVVAARESSLPEIVETSGVLIDLKDTGKAAQSLATLLNDDLQKARLKTLALKRDREFNREKTIDSIITLFSEIK